MMEWRNSLRCSAGDGVAYLPSAVATDGLNIVRLASVTDVDGWTCSPSSPLNYRTLGLEYDAARNFRKQVDSVGSVVDTAVVAAGNRVTNWGNRSHSFDLDGNMITRTSGATTTTFSYDGESMLRRTIVGSDTTCYEYNAFNQFIFSGTGCARNFWPGQSARKPKRIFVWDGEHIIAEVDSMASTRFAEYVYWPGIDRPYALLSDSGSTTIARFYHQDELGNVIGLTRGTSLAQTLTYEPWGVLVDSSGTLTDTSRLRWKGLYWEGGNTKLYHVRNRWYDPETRRFTSEDPIGTEGGLNLYMFAGNDPVNGSDPLGLRPCDEMGRDHWDETLVAYPLGGSNWDVKYHACPGVSGSGRGAALGPANSDGSGGGPSIGPRGPTNPRRVPEDRPLPKFLSDACLAQGGFLAAALVWDGLSYVPTIKLATSGARLATVGASLLRGLTGYNAKIKSVVGQAASMGATGFVSIGVNTTNYALGGGGSLGSYLKGFITPYTPSAAGRAWDACVG